MNWFRSIVLGAACGVACMATSPARAAEGPYPFEGVWVRQDGMGTGTATRTYTSHDVVSSRSRCTIRRVSASGSTYELREDCRYDNKPYTVTETVKMTSPNSMTLRRQLSRLKIPRQLRYVRQTPGSPGPGRSFRGH